MDRTEAFAHESDEALMLRYQQGDTAAFDALYGRHRGPLYRYLLRQCHARELAEELFQDVWLRVVHARERYHPSARFTTYLYRIAHNRFVDHLRGRRTRPAPSSDVSNDPDTLPASSTSSPDRRAHLDRQLDRLLGLLEALPAEQREAFVLREEAGLSVEAIAEATGVNPETAKSRLRYAVQKLRRGLGEAP